MPHKTPDLRPAEDSAQSTVQEKRPPRPPPSTPASETIDCPRMHARLRPYSPDEPEVSSDVSRSSELDPIAFRRRLMNWYRTHARELPWRGITDPYRTWVSEVMLQQTRVAAVIEHYHAFLRRFPTILALALA